jgi:RNA recognition motif-containing protein
MNIYVGNLSYDTRDGDLRQLFGRFGNVDSARVIVDRDTNRSKGFGFVEMENRAEAEKAIADLNGTDFQGRTITVNEAKPRESRPGGGGPRGGGRPGGGRPRY